MVTICEKCGICLSGTSGCLQTEEVNVPLSTSTVISNEIVENSTTMHRKYVFLSKVLCIKPEVRYISFHFFYLVKTSTCQKRLKMSNFGHMR